MPANAKSIAQKLIPIELLSSLGIISFMIVYYTATQYYPGGSEINTHSKGFSWLNNFWCHILKPSAINGQINPARILGILGMLLLCSSLILFYYQFANKMAVDYKWKSVIQNSGIISMLSAFFIFTDYHDFLISFSSVVGIPALMGISFVLYKSDLKILKNIGTLCLILFVVNNGVYYSKLGIQYLPVIQKVTFLLVFYWVLHANWHLNQLSKPS